MLSAGSLSYATSMRDNQSLLYHQTAVSVSPYFISVSPYFKGSIFKWFSMNYEAGYGFSSMSVESRLDSSVIKNNHNILLVHEIIRKFVAN